MALFLNELEREDGGDRVGASWDKKLLSPFLLSVFVFVSLPVPDNDGMVSVGNEEVLGFDGERSGERKFGMGMEDDKEAETRGAPGLDADADLDVLEFPRASAREEDLGFTGESGYLWISSGCIRPFRPMAFNYVLLHQLFSHFGAG